VLQILAERGYDIRRHGNGAGEELINVAEFARRKKLDAKFLDSQHVHDATTDYGQDAIAFEYRNLAGEITRTKIRHSLTKKGAHYWKPSGVASSLYGLWRIEQMHALDQRLILVEGESDALTLWQHEFSALGVPGANSWREEWAREIPESAQPYVVIEPDAGGKAMRACFNRSSLRERIRFIEMPREMKDPSGLYLANPGGFTDAFEQLIASAQPAEKPQRHIVLRHLADIVAERREPNWLLHQIIESHVLAVMAGARGTFKSFIALDWVMRMVRLGHPAIILSAEGAGLDRRVDAWMRIHATGVDLRSLPVLAHEHPANLRAPEVLEDLRAAAKEAGIASKLVLVDTFSKFAPGLDENDNAEVNAHLSQLAVDIRDAMDSTVLALAHTGHANPSRPRGASVLMCNTDAEYIVERPDLTKLRCSVSRQRFKDYQELPPMIYEGEVIDLGRTDSFGERVTSLIMRNTGIGRPPKKPLSGKQQNVLLRALRIRNEKDPGHIWSIEELREIGRELGMTYSTAHDVVDVVAFSPFMAPTIGGYRLNDE
jgi:hypothetical protein